MGVWGSFLSSVVCLQKPAGRLCFAGLLTLVRHRWKLVNSCPGPFRTRSGWLSNAGSVDRVVSPCRGLLGWGGSRCVGSPTWIPSQPIPGMGSHLVIRIEMGETSSRAYELSLLMGVDPGPAFPGVNRVQAFSRLMAFRATGKSRDVRWKKRAAPEVWLLRACRQVA
jgi:hypothetical protein